jgi:hypothetical protein
LDDFSIDWQKKDGNLLPHATRNPPADGGVKQEKTS